MCCINEKSDLLLDEFAKVEFSIESLIETLKSLEERKRQIASTFL